MLFSLKGLGQCDFKLFKVQKALEDMLVTTLLRNCIAEQLPQTLKEQRQYHIGNSLFRQQMQSMNVHGKSQ